MIEHVISKLVIKVFVLGYTYYYKRFLPVTLTSGRGEGENNLYIKELIHLRDSGDLVARIA